MVSASLNGTSYSAQAEMDIGEQTLQVSSLTTPIAGVPIQVNSAFNTMVKQDVSILS